MLIPFLHAPYKELATRWKRREIPVGYVEYLAAGRAAGRTATKLGLDIRFVDTSTPLTETFRKIQGIVKQQLELARVQECEYVVKL